jgi:hypothetical protein
MRTCNVCNTEKPVEEFHTSWDRRYGVRRVARRCKKCHSATVNAWRKRNRGRITESPMAAWRRQLRQRARKYGMEPYQLAVLEAASADLCAICGQRAALEIDHDHADGHVRGLICRDCNRGLGCFFDNPARLIRAALYLLRTKESPWASRP